MVWGNISTGDCVIAAQDGQVAGLGGRIATHIDHPLWGRLEDDLGHVRMDAGAGRIQNDHVGFAVPGDERFVQDIFHVSGKERAVGDSVGLCILPGVFDGFRNILDPNHFTRFCAHELGDGARSGVKVVNHLASTEGGKLTRNAVQPVCLQGIGLVERFGADLEAQSLHFFVDGLVSLV